MGCAPRPAGRYENDVVSLARQSHLLGGSAYHALAPVADDGVANPLARNNSNATRRVALCFIIRIGYE